MQLLIKYIPPKNRRVFRSERGSICETNDRKFECSYSDICLFSHRDIFDNLDDAKSFMERMGYVME